MWQVEHILSILLLRHKEQNYRRFTCYLSLASHTQKHSNTLYLVPGGFARNEWVFVGFHRPISWWSRVWMSGSTAAGHCATRRPCGLQSRRITLGTAASPTSAGVISCWSTHAHTHAHPYLSSCHITNTRGCHLFCACLMLLCPQTEVMNLQEQSSCRRVVPDWLLRPNSDAIYCLGYCSLFRCLMWFHCHANRVWNRQAFDCHKWRVTHLMPWHWKIRGDRKQVMAHWEKRGNLLTVTFLLNVAWRRRINTEQRQGSWMENHFI